MHSSYEWKTKRSGLLNRVVESFSYISQTTTKSDIILDVPINSPEDIVKLRNIGLASNKEAQAREEEAFSKPTNFQEWRLLWSCALLCWWFVLVRQKNGDVVLWLLMQISSRIFTILADSYSVIRFQLFVFPLLVTNNISLKKVSKIWRPFWREWGSVVKLHVLAEIHQTPTQLSNEWESSFLILAC